MLLAYLPISHEAEANTQALPQSSESEATSSSTPNSAIEGPSIATPPLFKHQKQQEQHLCMFVKRLQLMAPEKSLCAKVSAILWIDFEGNLKPRHDLSPRNHLTSQEETFGLLTTPGLTEAKITYGHVVFKHPLMPQPNSLIVGSLNFVLPQYSSNFKSPCPRHSYCHCQVFFSSFSLYFFYGPNTVQILASHQFQ